MNFYIEYGLLNKYPQTFIPIYCTLIGFRYKQLKNNNWKLFYENDIAKQLELIELVIIPMPFIIIPYVEKYC